MAHYAVMIEGRNLWTTIDGERVRAGFLVTRYVEAADRADAQGQAIDQVRDELETRPALNADDDPPRLTLTEVDEVARAEVPAIAPGLVLFPDDEA
jgi:hypothetical protein